MLVQCIMFGMHFNVFYVLFTLENLQKYIYVGLKEHSTYLWSQNMKCPIVNKTSFIILPTKEFLSPAKQVGHTIFNTLTSSTCHCISIIMKFFHHLLM